MRHSHVQGSPQVQQASRRVHRRCRRRGAHRCCHRRHAEANKRLVDTVGQGGANFVQNAILGPLKDKRVSTIDRIAISIGRKGTKPTGLDALAACTLNSAGTTGSTGATAEANKRLVDTVGQGGANFVQNAILGPLKDKRVSTIDRIAIAIGRQGTKPTGLDSLAACTLTK